MGMPANPVAAPLDVVPMMMKRKKNVARISVIKHATSPYLPGLRSPYPLDANPPATQSGLPDAIDPKRTRRQNCGDNLGYDVRHDVLVRASPCRPQAEGDRRIKMTTRDMADCVGHREHRQTEGEGHPEEPNAEVWEPCGQDGTATAPEHKPERPEKFGHYPSRHVVLHGTWLLHPSYGILPEVGSKRAAF
jgi:hypothetical protein